MQTGKSQSPTSNQTVMSGAPCLEKPEESDD
jgi:hypothetical protein